jgi:hypothetical protein
MIRVDSGKISCEELSHVPTEQDEQRVFTHPDIDHLGAKCIDVLFHINAPVSYSLPQSSGLCLDFSFENIGHICPTIRAIVESEHELPCVVTSMEILPSIWDRPGDVQSDHDDRGLKTTLVFSYDSRVRRARRIPSSPTGIHAVLFSQVIEKAFCQRRRNPHTNAGPASRQQTKTADRDAEDQAA